jgi:hypothetical protein
MSSSRDPLDYVLGFSVFVAIFILAVFLVLFSLAMGESLQWWEFNLVSDCNDYGQVCSTQ